MIGSPINKMEVGGTMDIQFMEEFFKRQYEDPVSEICKDDGEYYKLCQRVCRDIETFAARLHGVRAGVETSPDEAVGGCLIRTRDELLSLFNETLNDVGEKYAYIIEKAYLQGALDRERMLR